MYRRSLDDPEGFWREQAAILDWFYPPRTILDADMQEVDFAWYSGGRLNACYNCVDRHLKDKGEKTAIIWAEDEPGEYQRHHLPRAQAQRRPRRQRPPGPRRQEGRPGLHLPADDPRARLRHAGLRAHRGGPLGGLRRLLGGVAARPHPRRRLQAASITANEGLRGGKPIPLKATVDQAVEGLGMVETVLVARRTDAEVPMRSGRDLWLARTRPEAPLDLPGRVDGRRGPALHPLHLGLDGEAQGGAAHDRRLHGLRGDDAQVRLRPPSRGRHLLLRRRRRLGHRAQLHRLRAARQRRDDGDVRVDPHLSRRRPLLADRRRPRRQHLLHRAHRASAPSPAPATSR